jgi:hypothetical protein
MATVNAVGCRVAATLVDRPSRRDVTLICWLSEDRDDQALTPDYPESGR